MITKINILGTGALACFYGEQLAEHYAVQYVGKWKKGIDGLNTINGKTVAFNDAKLAQVPDLIIILNKSYQNSTNLKTIQYVGWQAPVLIIQNGIDNDSIFKNSLAQPVYLGSSAQGAKLKAPGIAENTGEGILYLEKNETIENLLTNFIKNNKAQTTNNINQIILKKLAMNAVINPTAALYNVINGGVTNAKPFEFATKIAREVAPYFIKRAIYSSFNDLLLDVKMVAQKTALNTNSMLSDKLTNRGTEIKAILGPIQKEIQSAFLEKIIIDLESN